MTNIVSKSGGNHLHGSTFEYVRNDAFDARNAITDATRSGPAPFRQNQFGAAVTGPIIKNRTFFSVGYDGWRYSKPDQSLSYVPTAAELNGDFTQTTVVRHELFNPFSGLSRQHFQCDASGNPLPTIPGPGGTRIQPAGTPCNKLPQDLISAKVQQFMKTYSAAPNRAEDPARNFIQNRSSTNNSNSFQVRVDHRFGDSDNVFFRYTEHRLTVTAPVGQVAFTAGDSQGRNYGGGWVHVFGPNLILDVRAGYAGRPGREPNLQHPLGINPMKELGFTDIDQFQGMLVSLAANEWTNGGSNFFGARGLAIRGNPNWSMTPNLSWIKGNHNVKAGFWFIRAKREQLNTFQQFNFADEQTGDPTRPAGTTGYSLASALLGLPSAFQGQLPIFGGGPVRFKYAAWAVYAQDEWKVRPNLTLTWACASTH